MIELVTAAHATISGEEEVLATIALVDGELVVQPEDDADAWAVVDNHEELGGDPDDFEEEYDGWSNGYVFARRVEDAEAQEPGPG